MHSAEPIRFMHGQCLDRASLLTSLEQPYACPHNGRANEYTFWRRKTGCL